MSYYKKYLKYKNKYIKLIGGGGKGTYNPKENICIPSVVNLEVQRKIYSINFLWLNRNIQNSYRLQQYIFPFNNKHIKYTEKMFINLEYIKNIINVIRWSQKNPTAVINIWHDSNPKMVENTSQLINNLLNYDELIIEFETLFKIIDNINLLNKYLRSREEKLEQIIHDKLTNQYVQININVDNPKIIDSFNIKQEFINKIDEINHVINFNDETQLITINQVVSLGKTLDNLRFEPILKLDRLKQLENSKPILEYFGLKIDGSPSLYDKIPVYFKVDLVRLMILLQLVQENPNSYAIYADFDTQPLDEEIIFTEQCLKILDTHGLVLPSGQPMAFFENSFHIIAGENLTCDNYMILSINKILIEYNIQKIIYEYPVKPQDVFHNYNDLFTYYFIIKFDLDINTGEIPNGDPILFLKDKEINISFNDDLIRAYKEEEITIEINKTNLLSLDMACIGYLLFSKMKTKYNGIFDEGFRFYNLRKYKSYYPIRDDLGNISPHHYNYDKKYL